MDELKLTPKVLIQLFIVVVLIPFLPMIISGQWDWLEAWIFAIVWIVGFIASRVLASKRNPGLLSERARMLDHPDALPWDRILAPLAGIGGGLIPLVAGFDARYNWPPDFSLAAELIALLVLIGGYLLASYALITNRFFSGMVRIQYDRDHKVVTDGPYRWIRHPGYTGALMSYLAAPVLLDAASALIPALLMVVVLVIRTRLEDRTLQEKLEGYAAYARRTRFRLVPGIW